MKLCAISVLLLLHSGAVGSLPPNSELIWNSAAQQGIRDSKLGAPMAARALAMVHTCMYDAWAAYDEQAEERN
jgi:hypothetical protein